MKKRTSSRRVKSTINSGLVELFGGRDERYCRFDRYGIKYIDYKESDFLRKFINPYGKILPRKVTGNRLKYQKKVATAIKRARFLAMLPYVGGDEQM